jgi:hypothetical protein
MATPRCPAPPTAGLRPLSAGVCAFVYRLDQLHGRTPSGYAPRSNEATPPNLAIRYHFPLEVALDPREPVIIETLIPNSTDFKQWGVAPDDIRHMASIHT